MTDKQLGEVPRARNAAIPLSEPQCQQGCHPCFLDCAMVSFLYRDVSSAVEEETDPAERQRLAEWRDDLTKRVLEIMPQGVFQ